MIEKAIELLVVSPKIAALAEEIRECRSLCHALFRDQRVELIRRHSKIAISSRGERRWVRSDIH